MEYRQTENAFNEGAPMSSRFLNIRSLPVKRSMSRISRQSVGTFGRRRSSEDNAQTMRFVRSSTSAHIQSSLASFFQQLKNYRTYEPIVTSHPLVEESTLKTAKKSSTVFSEYKRNSQNSNFDVNEYLKLADDIVSTSLIYVVSSLPNTDNFYATLDAPPVQKDTTGERSRNGRTVVQSRQEMTRESSFEQQSELFSHQAFRRLSSSFADGLVASETYSADGANSSAMNPKLKGKKSLRLELNLMDNHFSKSARTPSTLLRPEFSRRSTIISIMSPDELSNLPYHPGSEQYEKEELERQKVAWELLLQGDSKTPMLHRSKPQKVVSDYENNAEMRQWIAEKWKNRTHHHEEAALCIQRAFRCYLARVLTCRLRYLRHIRLLEVLCMEDEAKHSWDLSCKILSQENQSGGEAEHHMRMLQRVVQKLTAVILKRRAKKEAEKAERLELENYAATMMQKIWRGYVVRKNLTIAKSNIYLAEKGFNVEEASKGAAIIQNLWRSYKARKRLNETLSAVHMIERAFQCFLAKKLARQLRLEKEASQRREEERQAVEIIERFFLRIRQRKMETDKKLSSVSLIQRVGRGALQRFYVQESKAALMMQRIWRRRMACRLANEIFEWEMRKKQDEIIFFLQEDAALVIQGAWRSHVGRRGLKNSS